MAEPSASTPPAVARSRAGARVVQPIARAAQRPCARPGCPAPARATLRFAYASAEAVLDRLADVADPQAYDLCVAHAGRTQPPRGWGLVDLRPDDERVEVDRPEPRRDLGGEDTVAVLAAALRAVPDLAPSAPASEQPAPEPPAAPVAEEPSVAVATDAASGPDVPVAAPAARVPDAPSAPVAPRHDAPTPRPVPAAAGRGPRPTSDDRRR